MAVLLEYKCPCCGGKLEFDSTAQQMTCPYCGTSLDVATLKEYDDVLKNEQEDAEPVWETEQGSQWADENASVYTCQSCGAAIVADETTAAMSCPFCGNPVILTGRVAGELKPDYILPFKLNKEAAKQALRNHFKGKKLLPKRFRTEHQLDEIKGVYVPYWLFDAKTDANIRYHATRTRMWSDSQNDYTETQHYMLLRQGSVAFEHVPMDGSTKMPDDMMESIEPFDFSEAVDFQTAYMSGYVADRYDVSAEDCVPRVNQRIRTSTEELFASTAQGYDSVRAEKSNISLSRQKTKYALYPVWLLNVTWNGQRYPFAMNGQTGKLVGDLPMDKKLYWKYWAIWALSLSAVSYAVILLLRVLGIL